MTIPFHSEILRLQEGQFASLDLPGPGSPTTNRIYNTCRIEPPTVADCRLNVEETRITIQGLRAGAATLFLTIIDLDTGEIIDVPPIPLIVEGLPEE